MTAKAKVETRLVNFFSHGITLLDRPYELAGAAVPDWMSYLDRRVRARRKLAIEFVEDVDPQVAAVARGIVRHHDDDRTFHGCRAFTELNLEFTVQIRDRVPPDESMRPSFVGHILVELLLDSYLHQSYPGRLDRYYQALRSVNPATVESAVNRMATGKTDKLAKLIPRFIEERFLYDYDDDQQLLRRINQVMKRVGLDLLPDDMAEYFAIARGRVVERSEELLPWPIT